MPAAPWPARPHVVAHPESETGYVLEAPITTDGVDEVEQRVLAFETHHAVELGNHGEQSLGLERCVMTAHREVCGDAGAPERGQELGEARYQKLED